MKDRTRTVDDMGWVYNDAEEVWYFTSKQLGIPSMSIWRTWSHGGKYSLMRGCELDEHFPTVRAAMERAADYRNFLYKCFKEEGK